MKKRKNEQIERKSNKARFYLSLTACLIFVSTLTTEETTAAGESKYQSEQPLMAPEAPPSLPPTAPAFQRLPDSNSAQARTVGSQAQSSAAGSFPHETFLQGGVVEHAQRLEPVAPQLQAGAVFNAAALAPMQPNNDWYWIPSWYAGQKHVESEIILTETDLQSGRSIQLNRQVPIRQDLSIGFQADRNGQIWEFKRAPYTTRTDSGSYFTTLLVRNRDPLSVNQNQVILRMLETSILVDARTQRIIKSMQEEQINTYTPIAPGIMNMQTSIRSFAADGSPLQEESSVRTVTQSAAFSPVNFYEGKDMRALFAAFMQSHGYAQLLPEQAANPQAEQTQ
ncbi:MAG: hypothetical protein K2X27_24270 [Candidatus Obscuribacterales bacterium]|nr:hypothetical protein [Candidatus Obscuribacterales bacterium]